MKTYDFGVSWNEDVEIKFLTFLKKACREKKLSFIWLTEDNLKDIIRKIEQGRLRIRFFLDTEATYNKKGDLFSRLNYAIKDAEGTVINDPDRTKSSIDKSIMHFELVNAGIPTPYTIIVRNWEPNSYRLSDEEKQKLGIPFVIKPALGYGQLGVLRDARGTVREIAQARNFDRGDNFLLQEKIDPVYLGGKRAWFRVFNVFNAIIPCWWDDKQNHYEHVTYEEFNSFGLYPLVKIVAKIASLTQMAWFSTEITIDNKLGKKRFLAIDYVNDQCDMNTLSETPSGVPDDIVKLTVDYIVSAAFSFIRKTKLDKKYTIELKDAKIEVRGLGTPPEFLNPDHTKNISIQNHVKYKILQTFGDQEIKPQSLD